MSVITESLFIRSNDFAIDASNGDTNYFVGFRNGLRYAKSLIDGEEPQFESCTEQEPNGDLISKTEVRKFVEYIQSIKDNHNENQTPINYGTICEIVIEGWNLLKLPPVKKEPNTGHWIRLNDYTDEKDEHKCSKWIEEFLVEFKESEEK